MEHYDVVIAIVVNKAHQILLSRRQAHQHQAGKWEFPGGKIKPGETPQQALARELQEELGIAPLASQPLIRVEHTYPDCHVSLNVQEVSDYSGEAVALEGQEIRWHSLEMLANLDFPAANAPIVTAIRLPQYYLITPNPGRDWKQFLDRLEHALSSDIRLVQFRAPDLSVSDYLALARRVIERCKRYGARLLINADSEWVSEVAADGVHLSSSRLMSCRHRPLDAEYLVAASCHTVEELQKAGEIAADFVVLSPVNCTSSHAGFKPLGWEVFEALCSRVNLPVFALGGMRKEDVECARRAGAQGIAAISGLWPI